VGKVPPLRKIHEYHQHAAGCREMARTAPPGHRQHLEQMATTWEQLAAARKRQLLKQGKQDEKSGPHFYWEPAPVRSSR
jgi:hypothetical protein